MRRAQTPSGRAARWRRWRAAVLSPSVEGVALHRRWDTRRRAPARPGASCSQRMCQERPESRAGTVRRPAAAVGGAEQSPLPAPAPCAAVAATDEPLLRRDGDFRHSERLNGESIDSRLDAEQSPRLAPTLKLQRRRSSGGIASSVAFRVEGREKIGENGPPLWRSAGNTSLWAVGRLRAVGEQMGARCGSATPRAAVLAVRRLPWRHCGTLATTLLPVCPGIVPSRSFPSS